jgi:hypothetical protein
MAQRVEVTVADIVRSFAKGVIGERIAVRKLEKLMETVLKAEGRAMLDEVDRQLKERGERLVIHTDNL